MTEEYVSEVNLQTAMAEYKDLRLNRIAETPNGDQIGTVTQVYDNTRGVGEQVYAVVKNPYDNAEDVEKSYAIL